MPRAVRVVRALVTKGAERRTGPHWATAQSEFGRRSIASAWPGYPPEDRDRIVVDLAQQAADVR